MDEQKMPRRPRRSSTEEQPKNESLVYGKNPVTELLKSGSGVDTVLIAEGMAPAVAAYYTEETRFEADCEALESARWVEPTWRYWKTKSGGLNLWS